MLKKTQKMCGFISLESWVLGVRSRDSFSGSIHVRLSLCVKNRCCVDLPPLPIFVMLASNARDNFEITFLTVCIVREAIIDRRYGMA